MGAWRGDPPSYLASLCTAPFTAFRVGFRWRKRSRRLSGHVSFQHSEQIQRRTAPETKWRGEPCFVECPKSRGPGPCNQFSTKTHKQATGQTDQASSSVFCSRVSKPVRMKGVATGSPRSSVFFILPMATSGDNTPLLFCHIFHPRTAQCLADYYLLYCGHA